VHEDLKKARNSKTNTPEKLQLSSLHGWTSLNWEIENNLRSLRGISGIPLIYVIWGKEMNNVVLPEEDAIQELICLAPLEGPVYLEDKHCIYSIIREYLEPKDGHGYRMSRMRMVGWQLSTYSTTTMAPVPGHAESKMPKKPEGLSL